jgi:(2Fe-2S) ferredoxin
VPRPEIQILVCANERPADAAKPSCAPRGGLEVYRRFKDRVRALGVRDRVMVTRTGCLKHCSRGITVAIWPGNVWLGGVGLEDVDEILEAALAGEPGPGRLAMPDIPWE